MNAISRVAYTNDSEHLARASARSSDAAMGLGPNQLTWLRRNIGSFKQLEEQRRLLLQDAVRAARIAGLY